MAKFVVSHADGKFETFLEGKDGEDVSAEMVMAYAHMKMGWALGEIAEKLSDLDTTMGRIADALEK
jgi:tryptophan 2,3-dioxygenase